MSVTINFPLHKTTLILTQPAIAAFALQAKPFGDKVQASSAKVKATFDLRAI